MLPGSPILLVMFPGDERARLALALRYAGHAVIEAGTAREAIAVGLEVRPLLAILDERLPDAPGESVAETLRASELPALAIVLLTEVSRPAPVHYDVIVKPVAIGELLACVRGGLHAAQARSSGGAVGTPSP
jgi:two-component system KDP operon response regulator KdpE